MKSSSVRGTPVRHIGNTAHEGMSGAKPSGMSGTVNRQFEGDQSGNRQTGLKTGTPFNSRNGNSDEFSRTRSSDRKGGMVIDDAAGNQNDPKANGNGVLFDGVSRATDYLARDAGAMDSPVPLGAPILRHGAIRTENIEHLGQGIGASPSQAGDEILSIGGVMSRGMDGVDKPGDSEESLLEDDTLRNMGSGGAVG